MNANESFIARSNSAKSAWRLRGLAKAVRDARNTLVHQGTQAHDETIDQFYDLVIAIGYSIAWVLRTVLLPQAGIDAATVQHACKHSSRYIHHIANTGSLLAGGPYAAQ
jgi:hypothetical protein